MTSIHDGNGIALSDYARPSVTVDTAVLTVDTYYKELCVALVETPQGEHALPGTFLHENETLQEAANRALSDKVGIKGLSPVQLHVFDSLDRDPRGWVISVAHIAVVPIELLGSARLTPVSRAGRLAFDHNEMLDKAVERLRRDYAETPDPWNLLERFTLKELRDVHEAIDPNTPLRDSFRRLMQPLVVDTGQMSSGSVGKPSRVWRKETESERIMRKYAKLERPVSRNNSARTSSRPRKEMLLESGIAPLQNIEQFDSIGTFSSSDRSDREFSLEILWSSGETTKHENLSLSQAELRMKEFSREARDAWTNLALDLRPVEARIVSPFGDIQDRQTFD